MMIEIFPDMPSLAKAAEELFLEAASAALESDGHFVVSLAGGGTPRPLYELLGRGQAAGCLDWTRLHFFWGDERPVPPDHPESNFRSAYQSLLLPRGVPQSNIHRIRGELDPTLAASAYQAELLDFFREAPPRFDLILLGLGSDGHTASLFPGTEVVAHPSEYQWVAANHVPELDTWRITITPTLINLAKNVVFLVSGKSKAAALKNILEGPYVPEEYPSQLVNPPQGNLVWLIDSEAAARLDQA